MTGAWSDPAVRAAVQQVIRSTPTKGIEMNATVQLVQGHVITDEGFHQQPAGRHPETGQVTIWPLWGGAQIATPIEAATFVARS